MVRFSIDSSKGRTVKRKVKTAPNQTQKLSLSFGSEPTLTTVAPNQSLKTPTTLIFQTAYILSLSLRLSISVDSEETRNRRNGV